MNWRRGFFRLWLVLALLWWGGWGAIYVNTGVFNPAPQNSASIADSRSGNAVRPPPKIGEVVEGWVFLGGNPREAGNWRKHVQTPVGASPAPQNSPSIANLRSRLEKGISETNEERKQRALANWPYAVVPPFAVFVLGWAVAWALTGFKRSNT